MQQLHLSARKGFFTATAVALALAGALSGCSTASPDVVSRSHAQQMQSVRYAVIESMRPVVVDGSQSGLGAIAGAVAGGVAGSSVGGSREGLAVGVLGAVLGGALGNAVERSVTREQAVELVLRMDDGTRRAVVQTEGAQGLRVGDRVTVVGGSSGMRVSR